MGWGSRSTGKCAANSIKVTPAGIHQSLGGILVLEVFPELVFEKFLAVSPLRSDPAEAGGVWVSVR